MNTLSFLNISKECNVKKCTNVPMIVFCLLAFVAGAGLAAYASSGSSENTGMTGVFVGASIAVTSLVLMFVKRQKWVYVPTGNTLVQEALELDALQMKTLHPLLLQIAPLMEDVDYDVENSRILLDCIYTKDGVFATFQLSRYSSLMYVPLIEPVILTGNQAHEFVKLQKNVKHSNNQ